MSGQSIPEHFSQLIWLWCIANQNEVMNRRAVWNESTKRCNLTASNYWFFYLATFLLLLSLCSQLLLPEKCFLFLESSQVSPSTYFCWDNMLMQKIWSPCLATFLFQLAVHCVFYLARLSQNVVYTKDTSKWYFNIV